MSGDPRLPGLFAEAAELPAGERGAWLDFLRAREPDLAAELDALLAASAGDGGMLDAPAALLDDLEDGAPQEGESTLQWVGPYRIVREVGRGGMGRVFLAEEEGEHFRRRMALKVLESGHLGAEAVRRFRDEVRILASLEHPGIVRFLDGGRTPEGIWFLALEYVEGVGLIDHARTHALSSEDRVRLFVAVLDAVSHAHEHLVVHRDLKPSNILVGADGNPRLLDFGIAKLVDPEGGDDGTVTRTELRALTPAYASPEQFRGERATTASDVYSLGVILYELLAGVRPYRTTSTSRAELERAVLEDDPEPPSTAARRSSETHETSAGTQPRGRRLGPDLDAICLKALRKQPAERYASAAALADDLRRYLEGEPVAAHRGGRRYRLTRLLQRHRGRLATAGALALAAAALLWAGLHRALPAPAVRSASVAPQPFPSAGETSIPVEELQRRFAAEPSSVTAGAALVAALVRDNRTPEAAVVIGRLRQIPGGAGDPIVDHSEGLVATSLDEPQRALALHTRALATAEATGRRELVARLRAARGRSLSDLGRREEARAELATALTEAEASGDLGTTARTLNDLAIEELTRGQLAEGERLLLKALEANRKLGDERRSGAALHNLAGLAMQRGRADVAVARYREAAETFGRLHSARREAMSLGDLAHALHTLGRTAEARDPLEKAIAGLREAGDDTSLAYALCYRAGAAIDGGDLAGVEADAKAVEDAALASGSQTDLALAHVVRGRLAAARGDASGARRLLADARRILTEAGEVDLAAEAGLTAAELELAAGHGAEAAHLARESAASYGEGTDTDVAFGAALLLARADAATGRVEAARQRLAALGDDAERRPNVALRLELARARAELARAERPPPDARRELEAAVELARRSGRLLAELELRLLLAENQRDQGNTAAALATARAVRADAARHGLRALERRAQEIEARQAV
jgi:serine/threonine-protein kinase